MSDTSGDGIPDALAEEHGLDPNHEHHPLFSESLLLVEEHDPEFIPDFIDLVKAENPDPVAIPFIAQSLLTTYLTVVNRDPGIIPELNKQLLSSSSIEVIEQQLEVLASADSSFVVELAEEGQLGNPDWDDDGLKNWEELWYGSSYSDPDTSGDGLYDGEAVALGLSPTRQRDRLGNVATELRENGPLSGNELEYLQLIADDANRIADQIVEYGFHEDGEITDADLTRASDPDRDGLITALEEEVGTDPDSPDTSGDGLLDGWKYTGRAPNGNPLPNAEPRQMDLYVMVLYTDRASSLTSQEKSEIKQWWADFDVENSDGSTGINLHITDGPNGGRVDTVPDSRDVHGYRRTFHNEEYMGEYFRTHYLAVFGDIDVAGNINGQALIGGGTSVVAPGLSSRSRLQVLSHELLHNIVGELNEEYVSRRQIQCGLDEQSNPIHTCDGLLAPDARGTSVVSGVEDQITNVGFKPGVQAGLEGAHSSVTGFNHMEEGQRVASCNCLNNDSNT